MSSIDALLLWLDESIKDADLALRAELAELQGLTADGDHSKESRD